MNLCTFRSGGRTAADKYSPRKRKTGSAEKLNSTNTSDASNDAKRELFADVGVRPDMPLHDPYTPTKRLDPEYVPYYVTNFEYIIQCVIDCTDDKELFEEDELG